MKKKIYYVALLILFFLGPVRLVHAIATYDPPSKTDAILAKIDAAVQDVDPGMKRVSVTKDTPVTFVCDTGDTIVYHCLQTTYQEAPAQDITGLDRNAITLIIDPEAADTIRDCQVHGQPAILCTKGQRSYLCWTWSTEYSLVIEYTEGAVPEEEIFRMAEDLYTP